MNDLTIQDSLQLIRDYSSIDFIYSALPKIEEQIILGLGKWFDVLKEEEYYSEHVDISVVYPKEKSKSHQIVVECFAGDFQFEGIGKNEQTMIFQPDSTTYEEYKIKSGTLKYSSEIKCKSTSRQSVSKLADAILLGMQTEVKDFLYSIDINIMPNKIKLSNKITRTEIVKDTAWWEILITIEEIQTHWQQILTTEGEILKGVKYLINEV